LTKCFFREVLARGVLLHPRHLWFTSAAHSPSDIDETLATCQVALRETLALVPI
jgi:glutamate-1-semialdehyde aminotransferase